MPDQIPALVLAAGEGSRLRNYARQKPLLRIAGVPLTGRVLLGLKEAGIKHVYIVIGHEGEAIREYFGERYAGLDVHYVTARNWERGNLYSFFAAKGLFKQNFVLCMGDHLFDPQIVKTLINAPLDGVLVLAVDRVGYSPDDTRVRERNGRIVDIGKFLDGSNCVDTGLFLCSPMVFRFAKKAVEQGSSELADCIRLVAQKEGARVLDISGRYWVDVDTGEDLKRAKKLLATYSQKGRGASDFVAHYLNRPIENAIIQRICDSRITPNQLTIATNVLAYFVTYLFLLGHLSIGSILTFVVGIMDGLDGKLARIRGHPTKLGLLEHPLDLLFEFSWLIALALFLSRGVGSLPVVVVALSIALIAFYRMCYDQFSKATGVSLDVYGRFERGFRRVAGRRNIYNVYILIGVLLGAPLYSLIGILVHSALTAVIYCYRAAVNLHAIDRKDSKPSDTMAGA